ncbi:MAG: 1-acyl-sn-glycerol-3-phosphate acyltransferase [Bacteroidaceae bacterium]|nr:1-acyl-sn-glycerol-3-phosphate acyltransferase [Bacteroidaceae bacterium]
MKEKIQDGNFRYFFLKIFVDWAVKSSYCKYQVEGLENIPSNGYTIWASNHTNALMDPLVLLSSTRKQKVFMARADIFRKKRAASWLTFLKVMPIYRIRDGIEAVKKNDEVIAQATDILMDQVPLVLFPEATHRPKHSLLKLSKGIFHIAGSVYEHSGKEQVYIMPIGIEYGDYFRYRSTVLVRFGEPLDISGFIRDHADDPWPVQMLKLREILKERLSGLIAYLPDDEDYDGMWEYVKLRAAERNVFAGTLAKVEAESGCKLKGLMRNQAVDRYLIREALAMRESEPQATAELFSKADDLRLWRIQNGISVFSIADEKGWGKILIKFIMALVGLPYYLFSGLVSALIWIPTVVILGRVQDDAFYNTARFGTRFGLSIISFIVWCLVYFIILPWKWALAALILSLPALRYIYAYGAFVRRLLSDIRWKIRRRKAPDYSGVL